jgi:hypothetical protein
MANKSTTPEKPRRVSDLTPVIFSSLNKENTFFLFRVSGLEIQFTTFNGLIRSADYLHSFEKKYIKDKILNHDTN